MPAKFGEAHECSICKLTYIGFGNNAWPLTDGRCCDRCNNLVITARINGLKKPPTLPGIPVL